MAYFITDNEGSLQSNTHPKPTKEDLVAEAARYEEPARSTMIALNEFQLGLPVDRTCAFCHSAIRVWLLNPANTHAWQTGCDCGKCNDTFRGRDGHRSQRVAVDAQPGTNDFGGKVLTELRRGVRAVN